MPTFKEKCPEFGQKINVDGSDEDCIFIRHHDRGGFLVQYRERALLHRSNDEWISVSEEPQWTQITEDELYGEFVRFVSEIKPDTDENSARRLLYFIDLIDMAKEILKTNDIRFPRWCA